MFAEFEDSRDKDGFLKCEECPQRFFSKLAFEKHSSTQHNQEIETKLEISMPRLQNIFWS